MSSLYNQDSKLYIGGARHMSQPADTETNDNLTDASGIATSIGFFIYAAIWVLSIGRYFDISSTSDAALGCYIVALFILAIGIVTLGIELANKEVSSFLKRVVTGNLPSGLWGRPSAATWEAVGATGAVLIFVFIVHLIGIVLFDPTGIASGIIKLTILLLFSFVVLGVTVILDELVIKPLVITPAHQLAEVPEIPEYQATQRGNDSGDDSKTVNYGRRPFASRRVGIGILLIGEVLGGGYTLWQIVFGIFGAA